ncbi:MAG TPA: LLM class flavin-dependent oxidoreductase [Acidimicrobiales bacterium]|nr:LLM class flavin-dependent oxidoreductase [Acidimicrobiales bacterium]
MEVRGRQLHFGVHMQGQRTNWADYLSAVRAVEALGYGSVWTFDHLLPFSGDVEGPCFETLTTLGALAATTSRVRIGALVNGVVYRHPAVLAKAAAQVDQMSQGRLEFSLGAGWSAKEFGAYGLEFPSLAERYERLEEAMLIVKLLWSQDRSSFHGRYYRLDNAPCEPKPVQWPRPPITVGGTGLGALRAAAKHADRLNVIASPEKCADLVSALEGMRQQAGLDCDDIEFSVHTTLALTARSEDAEGYANRVAASHGVELAELRDTWLIGGPAAVTAQLRRYLAVGISHFIFAVGYPFDLAPLRLFQEEVLPSLF